MRKLFQKLRLTLAATLAVTLTTHGAAQGSASADISEALVRAHMEFLASDAMNGRGSFTDDEWRAATYIGSQLRRIGLEPLGDAGGFVQQIETGRSTVTDPPVLSFEGSEFTHTKEILVQGLGGGSVSGPLVRYIKGASIPAGAFLLLPPGAAPDDSMSAAGVVLLSLPQQTRQPWASTGPLSAIPTPTADGERSGPSRIVLSGEAHVRVDALPNGAEMNLRVNLKPQRTWNAIGKITGSDASRRSEVILLSAHLDHLGNQSTPGSDVDRTFNGADDDASGSTAVLALAEAMAAGRKPSRTMIFVWFGNEERGGFGARTFLNSPPVPLDLIVANLEFEMIGRPDSIVPPKTLWLTGYERSNLGPQLARRGAPLVADPHPDQRFFQRSDNIQLACRGVVAQTVSSFGLHREYHTPADDLTHIDFVHMTQAIRSMLAPVRWLANSDFKPEWLPGKKPEKGNPCR